MSLHSPSHHAHIRVLAQLYGNLLTFPVAYKKTVLRRKQRLRFTVF